MDRRNFLKCIGAFAAAAYLPTAPATIARAPAWAKGVVVYRCPPLLPGSYTFTAGVMTRPEDVVNYAAGDVIGQTPRSGAMWGEVAGLGGFKDMGLYIAGVKAMGGETLFEVPRTPGEIFSDARLKFGGIVLAPQRVPNEPVWLRGLLPADETQRIATSEMYACDFTDAEARALWERGEEVHEQNGKG